MTIGEQIKHYRIKRKLTQEQLAQLVGLSSKRVIWDYENGRIEPSGQVLSKIAKVLDCEYIQELREVHS